MKCWRRSNRDASRAPGNASRCGCRLTSSPPAKCWMNWQSSPHPASAPQPSVTVCYILEDGWPYVLVETVFTNPTGKPYQPDLNVRLRVETGTIAGSDFDGRLCSLYDPWFHQAYGVLADGHRLAVKVAGPILNLQYQAPDGNPVIIPPGGSVTITRRLFPAQDLFQLKAVAAGVLGIPQRQVTLAVDAPGVEREAITVTAKAGETLYAAGNFHSASDQGKLTLSLPANGQFTLKVVPFGVSAKETVAKPGENYFKFEFEQAATVTGYVTDENHRPIPYKVVFRGPRGRRTRISSPSRASLACAISATCPAGTH